MKTYREIEKTERESVAVVIVGYILSMIAIAIFFYVLFSFAGLLHNLIIK